MAESEQDVLVARLGQYAPDRYPVQHATTQFHLGSLLLHAGDMGAALHALTAAGELFARSGMRLEQAKTTMMLGIALRSVGRLEEAATAFTCAGSLLAELDAPAELGAAAYNLGLVRQDCGDLEGAHDAWRTARARFVAAGYPAQAAAAARDHGGSLLSIGKVADALPLLEQALTLAELAGDEPGAGAAANALGLARLAAQDPAGAVTALRRALGCFPRTVRPADHAMVKANLALAHEQTGEGARARLAAVQALALSSAAAPVRAQAQQVLARLPGRLDEDLLAVLDTEDREQWVPVLREEVLRACELPDSQRCEVVGGFLDGVLARPGASYDLAEALLQVALELPPRPFELLLSAVVRASANRPEQETERLHAVFGSALVRFAMPQWQRLAASLNAAAQAAEVPATWR